MRQPIGLRTQSRRRLEEGLALRFPRVASFLVRSVFRLPPRSRLRQAIVRRDVQLGFEATIRGDYEAAFMLYSSDCEVAPAPELVGFGFDLVYHGREERARFQGEWVAEWGEFQFEAEEIIDLGDDRLLVLGRMERAELRHADVSCTRPEGPSDRPEVRSHNPSIRARRRFAPGAHPVHGVTHA